MTWPVVTLDEDQKKKFNDWLAKRPPADVGAAGGRYVYSCCPTNMGAVLKVRDDVTNETLDLTDYESW